MTNHSIWWELLGGPMALNMLHGWFMNVIKVSIKAITVYVPRWVFDAPVDHKICIDFKDLHLMFRRQCLDVNLVTVWCMQVNMYHILNFLKSVCSFGSHPKRSILQDKGWMRKYKQEVEGSIS
jgi:hypothetical protein